MVKSSHSELLVMMVIGRWRYVCQGKSFTHQISDFSCSQPKWSATIPLKRHNWKGVIFQEIKVRQFYGTGASLTWQVSFPPIMKSSPGTVYDKLKSVFTITPIISLLSCSPTCVLVSSFSRDISAFGKSWPCLARSK